ncbi:MAG: DinB family protein [Candidatus Dormibacterales bacterium]
MTSWLAEASRIDDAQIQGPWTWAENPSGETLRVRNALYLLLEREQDAAARAIHTTYAAQQLALAQAAFGDLRGLLAGLNEELLDASPAPGEWTVRQTLRHTLEVELSYRTNTEWAIARMDTDPIRRPDALGPRPDESVLEGGIDAALARLAGARARSDSSLAEINGEALTRPSIWAGHEVDVAFRLRRFASHLVEHTIQIEKALDSLGVQLSEARRILRRISAVRGRHERGTGAEGLADMDARASALIAEIRSRR